MSKPSGLSFSQWQQLADDIEIPHLAYIDGRYQPALKGQTFACISPIDGRHLADIAACDEADVELAVAAARQAFSSGVWAGLSPQQRKKRLLRLADLVWQHQQELALLETLDMGKTISDSVKVDIPAVARCIQWHAEAIDKHYDQVAPTADNELAMIRHEPLGVVAAIVPWNFPLMMAAWKLAPALATGNSVLLKPSERSPLTAIRFAALVEQAGIPAGVFNVLPGMGSVTGRALALHNDIDGLVFTGSTAVGKQLMQMAGQSNLKRVYLECGGKSPNIVFADCPDIERAATAAAAAIFYNQGEVCVAGARLLVENSIREVFVDAVIKAAQTMRPGHPLDPASFNGAMVDQQHTESVMRYIEMGLSQGAKIRCGGQQLLQQSGGFYIEPTVFDQVAPEMTIAREEIFGPVLSVMGFDSEEQAVSIANDSDFGLAAAVWTGQLGRAHRVARQLRAGSVWINCFNEGDMTVPFGGYKQSGNGRDKSLHALEKYTETKTTWINLD